MIKEEKIMIKEENLHEGWKLVDLKDVVYFQEGPGLRKWQFKNEGIKVVNVKNIVNGSLKLGNTERHCSEEEVKEKYKHFLLNENEIVMASSGVTWGKTAIVKKEHLPLLLNTSVIRFKSLDETILTRGYLLYFLNSIYFKKQIERMITGGCQPNFGPYHLKKVTFLLPPLKTQQKIVEIIEKAEELKEWRVEADVLIDKYLKSVFLEMFGDHRVNSKNFEVKSFLEIFNVTTGKLNSNASVENGKYPFFTCSKETFHIDSYSFDCEALLLSGNNAAGKYSVKHYNGKFDAYQRTYVLSLKNETNSFRFLQFLLEYKLKELQEKSIGTNTKYLTMGILKKINLIIPPIHLQNQFAEIVKKLEQIKAEQKQSKAQINNLFNTLMQKAFKGELTC